MVKMETWENAQPRTPSVAILLNQLCLRSECEEEVVELDTSNTTLNRAPFPSCDPMPEAQPHHRTACGRHKHPQESTSSIPHTGTEISGKI